MKTLLLAAIRCSMLFVLPTLTYAISAQWDLDPISGDWNTADNWTPNGVPNGPADIATFGLSNTTGVSISEDTEVNSIIFAQAATNPYSITVNAGLTLTVSGVGITNNSGMTQNFVTVAGGEIRFTNNATSGSNVSISNQGGTTNFFDHSTGFGINEAGGTTNFFDHSTGGVDDEGGGTTNFFDQSTATGIANFFGTVNFFDKSTAGSAFIRNFGPLNFFDNSTAGNAFIENDVGVMNFFDNSSAGNAFIDNESGGTTNFFDSSTAGSSQINNRFFGSITNFFDRSSAGSATFTTEFDAGGGVTNFFDNSSAGTSTTSGDGFETNFFDRSSAGSATISLFSETNNSIVRFADFSTAGSATIILEPATSGLRSLLSFEDFSQGGRAQIQFVGPGPFAPDVGILDISAHNAPGVTVGSIEDQGNVFLGANNLTVGSNNLSTTFSGVIQDGGQNGGTGGSLTKIGTGTFILSGANTYTGDTNVNRGVLQVDGSITSNTFVNRRGTLAGTGTINGALTNQGTVSPGSPTGTLTVDNFTQAKYADMMIQIANTSDFGVLNVLGTANLSGRLDAVLLNGFVPAVGDSFTFLTADAVNGTLLMRNRNIDDVTEHWDISYFPTFAVLTVAAGNVPVPDEGTTFLLLTLALLALVAYQRQWARKQS